MKNEKHEKLVIGIVIGVLVVGLFFGLMAIFNIGPFANSEDTTISGTFNINGPVPDGATITIVGKQVDGKDPMQEVEKDIPAVDGSAFEISGLEEGKTYIGQAQVFSDGEKIGESEVITVTAPASNETIVINVSSDEATGNAVISGTVQVNGYIPPSSTITMEARVAGSASYQVMREGVPAKSRQFMSTETALEGQSYEIVGVLIDSAGNRIGTSPVLFVTAPATNEILTINSQANPANTTPAPGEPTPTQAPSNAVVSGSIDLNGVAPSNSRIVILQRPSDSNSDFQVAVDNVSPTNGATWQWKGAKASSWYELVAVLKQRQQNGTDKDISSSPYQTVAAPATNVTLSLNTGLSLSAPSGQVTLTCNNQSGDQWNATITMPYVYGAGSYWYQVGTTQGGSNVQNATVNASGSNDAKANISLGNQQTYYFRYAYSNQSNQAAGSTSFSPFSTSSQGSCGF